MRMQTQRMWTWILASALAGSLAAPATAGSVFKWTTDDGTVSYTDDPKRIPARYRDAARKEDRGGLGGYARFTPNDDRAQDRYVERLQERLVRLRETRREAERERLEAAAARPLTTLNLAGPGDTRFEVGVPDGEPVVVERVRVRNEGSDATHHNTVVRQGNRTLMVVRGQWDRQTNPSDVVSERELLSQ